MKNLIEITREEFREALNLRIEDEFTKNETKFDNHISLLIEETLMNEKYKLRYFEIMKEERKEYYFLCKIK
jgi:hypothetical protein